MRTGIRRFALALVGLVAASLVLGFLLFASVATRSAPEVTRAADAIVVLTGGSQRIGEAARLLRARRAKRLLISGVNRKTSEAAIRRVAQIDRTLFDCCVTLGYGARNTRGNAVEARDWQRRHKFRSLIVVTSAYHMPRSLTELALKMPDVELIAHPVVPAQFKAAPWWLHAANAKLLAREYVKFLPSAAKFAFSMAFDSRSSAATVPNSYHAGTRP